MRMPTYLSPSAIKTFENDIEDYAVKYLLTNRPPRAPQTEPMSVGSAFDAYAKSYLHYALFGHYGADGEYEKDTIFENQVEEHVRDWAREAGEVCFEGYKKCGALRDLLRELEKAVGPPRFEFDVTDYVSDVPLLGKPDIYFVNHEGVRVVYDWKVNGYCSSRNTSPMKGYVCCRDLARGSSYPHKDAVLAPFKGVTINCMMHLEDGNAEWADQLSIYSWLLGEPVGGENVVFGIDQITGPGCSRITSHRLRIKPEWQYRQMERIVQIWQILESGHIFRDLSREESDNKLKILEAMWVNNPVDDIL